MRYPDVRIRHILPRHRRSRQRKRLPMAKPTAIAQTNNAPSKERMLTTLETLKISDSGRKIAELQQENQNLNKYIMDLENDLAVMSNTPQIAANPSDSSVTAGEGSSEAGVRTPMACSPERGTASASLANSVDRDSSSQHSTIPQPSRDTSMIATSIPIIDAKRAPDVKIPLDLDTVRAATHKRHVPFTPARKARLDIVQGVQPVRRRHDAAIFEEIGRDNPGIEHCRRAPLQRGFPHCICWRKQSTRRSTERHA